MNVTLEKDNKIIRAFVKGGKVLTTLQINGSWVSNPTLEQLYEDGWEEYTPPTPEPYIPSQEELYKQRVIELIRERYDNDDELAILRQRDTKPDEFAAYNTYVEQCKTTAHAEVYGEEQEQEIKPEPDE